jgi:hypothetical protein
MIGDTKVPAAEQAPPMPRREACLVDQAGPQPQDPIAPPSAQEMAVDSDMQADRSEITREESAGPFSAKGRHVAEEG